MPTHYYETAAVRARNSRHLPFSYYARSASLVLYSTPIALKSSLPPPPPSIHPNQSPVDADWDHLIHQLVTATEHARPLPSNLDRIVYENDGFHSTMYSSLINSLPKDLLSDLDADRFVSVWDAHPDGPQQAPTALLSHTGPDKTYTNEWLLHQCQAHLYELACIGEQSPLDPETLRSIICDALQSDQRNDLVSASLFDILGPTAMPLCSELIQNRDTIVSTVVAERKAANRAAHNDVFTHHTQQLLRGPAPMPTGEIVDRRSVIDSYPGVFRSGNTAARARLSVNVSLYGDRFALPEGSYKQTAPDYEECVIPASKAGPPLDDAQIITVDKLPTWARPCYDEYKSLNKVQSLVYPVAFKSNANLLVCAPTGAGKTDVALLAVLKCISNYILTPDDSGDPGDLDRDEHVPPPKSGRSKPSIRIAKKDFKIVYVAPMKALAAEIVAKFSKRLAPLGIKVRELTGDMQLTKQEIIATQMIVTTPEKWDVITRKSVGDNELAQKVKLLVIDEVHLLNEDRGTVLETLVARTQRQIETSQSLIRIVGLSATLPNFVDVAEFLKVNPEIGLFYFDDGYRPVPLTQHFVGIKGGKTGSTGQRAALDRACFDKVRDQLTQGHQVMVFVHTRKDTYNASKSMYELANRDAATELLSCTDHEKHPYWASMVAKSRSPQIKEIFELGMGIHHAGLLRSDRTLTENLFASGVIKVLFCTATLAWGVNLPAHAVVIRGTDVYDVQKGAFVDLGILDVLQIFGRAGRPQFETEGVGYILTPIEKMPRYLSQMTQQHPIESQFATAMVDNLNAEIALGTVANVFEAIQWLGYTYLYVRMRKNPAKYGIDVDDDPLFTLKRAELVRQAALILARNQMVIYDQATGLLATKNIGRIASMYYIKHPTIEMLNAKLVEGMTAADVVQLLSECHEFQQLKLRLEETSELKKLYKSEKCPLHIKDKEVCESSTKVNLLLQAYISQARIEEFSLISDTMYIAQNAGRILRAMFEFAQNYDYMATCDSVLEMMKGVERRMWSFVHPLAQFPVLGFEIVKKLTDLKDTGVELLRDLAPGDIGQLLNFHRMGHLVSECAWQFPWLEVDGKLAPIMASVVELHLEIVCNFDWLDAVHGSAQVFWVWVTGPDQDVFHKESILLQKAKRFEPLLMSVKLPINPEDPPSQLYVRWVSESWIGSESIITITLDKLIMPDMYTPHTDLLPLNPLPITALKNSALELLYQPKFHYFNPIQTQVFHTLYHSRVNVLLGAPTGSGKTIAAEIAMWATLRDFPKSKIVYIAPMKALVRERVDDWRVKLAPLNLSVVELTGDVAPNIEMLIKGDVIITTPEKWDGVSRSWRNRSYVQAVRCVIIDEIHLLGGDRGPILEVIVSRMHYISQSTNMSIRIIGLSTALANARDLADWLGITSSGLFNFRHSVRPVQLETYIDGFPGKHYCPRMVSMNRPCYAAILKHSPKKPVLVFVSSRRQTRLTAYDLISYCCLNDNSKQFLHIDDEELTSVLQRTKDTHLQHTLAFGIGMHHAGLTQADRSVVEELFISQKIQILVATSTLAWGVNTPAHLVCIKGTEFYDAKKKKYVDFDITDVLQMMGRAGRPGFDDKGIACVFVEESKKSFYKKFLHSPFPVESSLHKALHDHMNAEIATGTVRSKQDALDYVTWTYFFRRLQRNPSYYELESPDPEHVDQYLSKLIDGIMADLNQAGMIRLNDISVTTTRMGEIASYYYLLYQTLEHFNYTIRFGNPIATPAKILEILALAQEFAELPVRHNEDLQNRQLAAELPISVAHFPGWDSPHLKTHLLLQAHLSQASLPVVDYYTDTISVLDQSVRVLQAMLDVAVEKKLEHVCLQVVYMLQQIKQGQWLTDSNMNQLPAGIQVPQGIKSVNQLFQLKLQDQLHPKLLKYIANLPYIKVEIKTRETPANDSSGKHYLQVTVARSSRSPKHRTIFDTRIQAPRFPKVQYEGWYLLVVGPPSIPKVDGQGEQNNFAETKKVGAGQQQGHAIELKRFQFRNQNRISMNIPMFGRGSRVYVLCDGYLGLDQEFTL